VIIVEDAILLAMELESGLEEAGAEVSSVGDGVQACDAVLQAEARGAPFAAVILDIEMPRLDGREAARRLRRDGYRGPLLALTAAAMKGEGARCLEAGFDAYLSKPVERIQLLGAVRELLARAPVASRVAAVEAQPKEAAPKETPKETPSGTGILVVDDDPDAAESLAALLEMEGHRVRTAPDGATALRLAQSEPPALVFLDLTFPHESGYEILASLLPILGEAHGAAIALSGRDGYEEKQRALRAGFRAYLGKPVSIDTLLATVDRLTAENGKGPPPGGSERAERRMSG